MKEEQKKVVKEEQKNKEKKKTIKELTILGIPVWKIFAYFVIYSVAGYIIETGYGALTKGVIESRKSFLYGPFCSIYGLGAVVMIVFLQYFNQNNIRRFWGGFIVGSVTEYLVSLFGELILNVKWWDYSNQHFNINGRICVSYSIFWGVLAIYLMSYLNPRVDKIIDKIKEKIEVKCLKICTNFLVIFLFLDCIISVWAVKMFYVKTVAIHDIQVENQAAIETYYQKIQENEKLVEFINQFFSDEKMIKTYPNLKIEDQEGNMIYFDSLYPEIQPYYVKISDIKSYNKF